MVPARTLAMMMFQGGDAAGSDHMQWLVIFVGVIAICSLVQFLVVAGAAFAGFKAYKSISAEAGVLKQKAMPIIASVQGVVEDMRPKISAVSAKVQEVVEDTTPKVKVVTTKFQEIVEDSTPKIKVMTTKVQEVVEDATPKIKVVTTKFQEIVEDTTPKVKVVTGNIAEISDVAKNKVHEFEATLDKANETLREANDKTRAQMDKVDDMVSSALKKTTDVGNTIQRGMRAPAGVVKAMKASVESLIRRGKETISHATEKKPGTTSGRYSAGGPTRVPSAGGPVSPANPSSSVAPSPGAEEAVERFRKETSGTTI